ncbi:hypothetical protein [Actinacidiphila glaucinigra]|uniref:hypothetical protein n=1 Tax=Actinacidiphila glaucinigra TaxID=235986 RepID=UPI0036ECCE64
MTLAFTACGRLTVMPPPEGEPVVLKPAELATTWTDYNDGTLTLKQDGTFIADKVCVAVGWHDGLAWSGTGTWKPVTGTWQQDRNKKQSFLDVTFDTAHSYDDYYPEGERRPDSYAALRHGKVLTLWAPVGDPDNDDPHCILTSPAG